MERNQNNLERFVKQPTLNYDGVNVRIFKRSEENQIQNQNFLRYDCQLCNVTGLQGEALYTHENGKKHQKHLEISAFRQSNLAGVIHQCLLLSIVKKQKKPIIGLGYVIEISDKSIFVCTLCDKSCDPKNVISHLTSHRHRMNFLNLNFKNFMKKLNDEEAFNMDMNKREATLTEFSKCIQSKVGLHTPTILSTTQFYGPDNENYKKKIKETGCFLGKDARDIRKEFNKIAGKYFYEDEDEESSSNEDFSDRRPIESLKNVKHPLSVDTVLTHQLGNLSTEPQKSLCSEKFVTNLDEELTKLETTLKSYMKHPESHPEYKEEWKIFWAKKYKEVESAGLDPHKYDYKSEWIIYWSKKVQELHEKEVEKVKMSIRGKSNPSLNSVVDESLISTKRASPKHCESETDVHPRKKYRPDIATDTKVESLHNTSTESSDDSQVNVITVLRDLSALELELGLLAQSVIDYMMEAVRMDNVKPNSSDDLLNDEKFHNTLDTCRHKLKGIIAADFSEPQRVSLVKQSVQKIAMLLQKQPNSLNTNEVTKLIPSDQTISVDNSEDAIFKLKLEIARTITDSFKKQGRVDVSAEEIEKTVEEIFAELQEDKKELESQTDEENCGELTNLTDEEIELLLTNYSDLNENEQDQMNHFLNIIRRTNPERFAHFESFFNVR